MATLYLVRHARPQSSYGDSIDPGLDQTGHAQAMRVVGELTSSLPNRLPVYTSPLRRCRETAKPLAEAWGVQPIVFPEIGEIPAPPLSLKERQAWLRKIMASDWADVPALAPAGSPDYPAWRSALLAAVQAMAGDAVIFSHFIAINVVAGAARGSDRFVSFRPDHASVTTVEVGEGGIAIKALGREADGGETSILVGR